jgi:hypothetical protein
MLRYLAPYLTFAFVAAVASAIAYGAGTINAAGIYAIMFPVMVVVAVGAHRWEERNRHRQ